MKSLCFLIGKKLEDLFLVLLSESKSISLVCYISQSLIETNNLNASEIVKRICVEIDGAGGGQTHFAAGSGKKTISIKELIKISKEFL
jgi:alanyl-tRNA synthetase